MSNESTNIIETMSAELEHLRPMEASLEMAEADIKAYKQRIAVLEKEIAELNEERRWRKFPDEKPTEDIKFLVINEKGFIQCCYYSPILKEFQIPVTHWMPLPSAPKEAK